MRAILKKIILFWRSVKIKFIKRNQKTSLMNKTETTMEDMQDIEKKETVPNLARGFACPYPGYSFGTCQDNLYADTGNAFFSVVDGVSEGMGQSYYAMLLSKYKSDSEDIRLTKDDAEKIHDEWKEYQESLIAQGRMPRTAHELYNKGKWAQATYVRLKFYSGKSEEDCIRWKCAVLGDSALLHISKSDEVLKIKHVMMSNENVRADNFKYSDSKGYYDFSEAPDSLDKVGTWLENEAYIEDISCEVGDIFLLATDHVAAWLLDDATKSIDRINQLVSVQTQKEFQELLDKEREVNPETGYQNMGDDDSTAYIIEINDPMNLEFNVTAIIDPRKKYEEEKALKKAAIETKATSDDSNCTSCSIETQQDKDNNKKD